MHRQCSDISGMSFEWFNALCLVIYFALTLFAIALVSLLLLMPTVDLVTLALEMRASYPIALQVHSPVSYTHLTLPTIYSV